MRNPTFAAIIPVRNEEQSIPSLLSFSDCFDEIIFVDGNSKDRTIDSITTFFPRSKILIQGIGQRGKGNAILLGMLACNSDFIFILDADAPVNRHEVENIKALISFDPSLDLVKGSRHLEGGGSEDLTSIRRLGAKFLALVTRVLHNVTWSEVCYGFWCIKSNFLNSLSLQDLIVERNMKQLRGALPYGWSFEFDQVLFLRSKKAGGNILEVPSYELSREFGMSSLNALKDGLRSLYVIVFERLHS